ncbi:hypothetical protein OUZ56_025349 [Daphnia magna]|uniref:Uncharacterized protein n=1 Tax=Daphnia magna TaxID=35525 RepID=A0ABQ9ZJK3_9CRUS|nr:hypothetical protein OUZ56_025349 [Daphnia magna]
MAKEHRNGSRIAEHNLSQAWLQQDVGEGLEKLMRIVCDKIRVLEERKLQLQCNVLLSGGILALWLFKKEFLRKQDFNFTDNSDSVIAPKSSKVSKQPPLQPNPDIRFRGFPSDAHYRANVAYRQKTGRDRPNGRNLTLLCDCSDMRPAVLNVVTHNADHILNRGADYFWCSRKAIKKIGQSVDDLTPIQKLEYNKRFRGFHVQV